MTKKTVKAAKKTVKAAKKPYNAAGYNRAGIESIVKDEEYKRLGTAGYPWGDKLKAKMVEDCNGLKTGADIVAKIAEMAP
ncbi:hypothetical protein CO670_15485 [Rhizobium sp. J15]|uniref:hypothetical protein n=1 Tax=Rhizobium sp. J15 TaxID=2035450 RepID=UPI000BEAC491|nr:hypothetical protein [Rhizobium sp. J15]PDT15896.1 hypothetical protein CO670_15485 [Rhizobium sp. J15]